MSTVLAETAGTKWDIQDHQLIPQVDNKSTYYNEKTGETYFKVFLLNNKVNKRKFKLTNLQQMFKDVDGYENTSLTFVKDGIRKGNHPNPKDANIFEANYQNKYDYVTKAINYYNTFGVAKIVKIFKPDPNLLVASSDPIANFYALCKTTNPTMLELLASAERENKNIYVSPAMFSWDWIKDPVTGIVSVNSFVPTHLAIVDSPAYDPEVAYIKKQTCQKDGMSCYYELFEASEVENLNNNIPPTNNMTEVPRNFIDYAKSNWNVEVKDAKEIPAEELVKNIGNYVVIDKTKLNQTTNPQPQPTAAPAPQNNNNSTNNDNRSESSTNEEQKEVPKKETTKEKTEKTSFTLEDVKALLAEERKAILQEIKAEQTKGERETLLDTYIQNEKVKSLKDKLDTEKLNKTKELYNSLPLDNEQLKTLLNNSIFNPDFANVDVYSSILTVEKQTADNNTNTENEKPKPQGAPKDPAIPKANVPASTGGTGSVKPITDIPPKPNANMNMFGTEFKNSANTSNKYNDDYKTKNGKSFEASGANNEYRPEPTTGKGVPKAYKQYIQ